jgi:plastocyanin
MKGIVISIIVLVLLLGVGFYFISSKSNSTTGSTISNDNSGSSVSDQVTALANGNEVTFDLTSSHFRFYLNGVESPDLKVKQGDKVKIILNNEEGFHDWKLDEFNAATKQIKAGSSDTIEFVADKKGTFEYYCSVGQHRANGMKGKFIVE